MIGISWWHRRFSDFLCKSTSCNKSYVKVALLVQSRLQVPVTPETARHRVVAADLAAPLLIPSIQPSVIPPSTTAHLLLTHPLHTRVPTYPLTYRGTCLPWYYI